MAPRLRKLLLLIHVTVAVGWIGAVASFLALSIAGLLSRDGATVRASYVAMNFISLFVVIPFGCATLATGLIKAVATPWGLLRHYWVITKLVLGGVALTLLLLHQYSAVGVAAQLARSGALETDLHLGKLGIQLAIDASLAIAALVSAVALAVYKPRGLTAYGRRRQQAFNLADAALVQAPRTPIGLATLLALLTAVVGVGALVHLSGLHGG